MANNKHLTLTERYTIESGLNNNASRTAIAETLNKSKSTICKEVISHNVLQVFSRIGTPAKGTYDCTKIHECGYKSFCPNACSNRVPVPCKRKDSPSGVCNGCPQKGSCKLTKKLYIAEEAQADYEYTLVDSRVGWDITYSQAKELANTLGPCLKQGQSIAAILMENPNIDYSEKTIYNYIEQGVFREFGINNMDLRKKVSRKETKKKYVFKPRENRQYLKGRTYSDYERYIAEHPNASILEMDTVYNDVSNGPFIQTFQFVKYNFMIGIYHDTKTAQDMLEGLRTLHDALGEETFKKFAEVILTDRGTEFTMVEEMEALGCKVFYCDPMCSWQKPHVENNHILFRYICPKKTNLKQLGLHGQEDLDTIFSHINSYPREVLQGKSPIQVFRFFYPESNVLEQLKIKEIDPDQINLKPNLIKK